MYNVMAVIEDTNTKGLTVAVNRFHGNEGYYLL